MLAACLVSSLGVAADNDRGTAASEMNFFAADLYGQVRQRPGNLFFSPESIATALAMTLAGARGDTATEMASVLRFTLPPDRLHAALGDLLRERNAPHDGYRLAEADALWGQTGYPLRGDFLALLKNDYGAALTPLDFKTDAEAARQTINRWVAGKTEDKIVDLIAPGILTADTRLVLTNAIYFKAGWAVPFLASATSDEEFRVSAARTIKTPSMHQTGGFYYLDGGLFQALELPYRGGELSMVVFLPKEQDGLPNFEQAPLDRLLPEWLDGLRPYPRIVVTLPKFTVRTTVSLKPVLQAMGMKRAFDGVAADFSGMTGGKDFSLSAVLHQAFVETDENGTEAAAATAVVVAPTTSARQPSEPPPPIIFRADHPFMFLIRDNRSGIILFMGRVADPST
jgi:serpin B